MSTLNFKLRQAPAIPVDLSVLIPSRLAGLSTEDIEGLPLGAFKVGDLFEVSGTLSDAIVISGGSPLLDYVGAGLDGGSITVEGHVGAYAARGMRSGRLNIRGDAGPYLASAVRDGIVHVTGSAGNFAGGARPGDKFGMVGGTVLIENDVGERAGERMRRGTIIARGKFGAAAGSRMVGGTLWTETGFGPRPGPLLRRGTLIGPKVDYMLPTFADCGRIDPVILRILSRFVDQTLGALAPKPLPPMVQKFAGDLATIGKGEILLTG
jgi:formylmethanofuran dehydrogenase subunit C